LALLTTTTLAVHHRCITTTALGGAGRNPSVGRYRVVEPGTPKGERFGEELDCLGERVDRPGIDENESARHRRVLSSELDGDHPAEAVTDYHRLRDSNRGAEPSEVIGEVRDTVASRRAATAAAPAQVEGGHSVRVREMIELRPERRVIAAPTVNEQQLRIAAASPLVVQRQTVEFRVRQDAAILSRQAQRHQPRVRKRPVA
jgi:hypothetical protein